MTEARRATLRDIASALGLSVNTVSRALGDKDSVSARTRAAVQAEAARIGYVPNTLARSLVLGSAMTLGLVITNPSNPFYAQLISSIELRVRAQGYSLLLLVTDESAENEQRATEALLRSAVDGAVVVPVQAEWDHWRRVRDTGIPLVFVNRDVPELDCDMVGVDYERGSYEATSHLVAGGARRLLLLEEDLPITTTADRISGFRRAMTDAGLDVSDDLIRTVPTRRYDSLALPWQPEEAYRFAQTLFTDGHPDAIVTGNDYFALGLLRVLAERGLTVPDDVAITGYGDHPYAAYLQTPLTTVRLPAAEVGTTAVDLLLQRLKTAVERPRKTLIRPELVVRASTGGRPTLTNLREQPSPTLG
ncbi:LacI family DNA-binding transcriptional regulator [Kribbella solani]|uniref:LacI family DNA-binding transcriptional regulator n=1 Tax=Kribbella solani TaxID=236067 RepID=UPI0029A6C460|nr:LacI family DNA-binding transcriptional regulator [Kribbella solani]MDX2973141.1 LacI family DNA-binding transcriptional regulator [Kribbella solani]MDX3004530.1 LacI family DNA-binding transcriptional regulator [Kribbella solani]